MGVEGSTDGQTNRRSSMWQHKSPLATKNSSSWCQCSAESFVFEPSNFHNAVGTHRTPWDHAPLYAPQHPSQLKPTGKRKCGFWCCKERFTEMETWYTMRQYRTGTRQWGAVKRLRNAICGSPQLNPLFPMIRQSQCRCIDVPNFIHHFRWFCILFHVMNGFRIRHLKQQINSHQWNNPVEAIEAVRETKEQNHGKDLPELNVVLHVCLMFSVKWFSSQVFYWSGLQGDCTMQVTGTMSTRMRWNSEAPWVLLQVTMRLQNLSEWNTINNLYDVYTSFLGQPLNHKDACYWNFIHKKIWKTFRWWSSFPKQENCSCVWKTAQIVKSSFLQSFWAEKLKTKKFIFSHWGSEIYIFFPRSWLWALSQDLVLWSLCEQSCDVYTRRTWGDTDSHEILHAVSLFWKEGTQRKIGADIYNNTTDTTQLSHE